MAMIDDQRDDCLLQVAVQPDPDIVAVEIQRLVNELSAEHAGFVAAFDQEAGLVVVRGRDELHLEESALLIKSRLSGKTQLGAPQVMYRETIRRRAESDVKVPSGAGSTARVWLAIEPLETGNGREFENETGEDAASLALAGEIEDAIDGVLDQGVLQGFPMTDLGVTLLAAACPTDGTKIENLARAAVVALRDALHRSAPKLLEPVGDFEVTAPEDFLGDIIADLNRRRGGICAVDAREDLTVIEAEVPLAQMFGFANTLANLSGGNATCALKSTRYQRAPTRPKDDPPPSEPAAAALRA